MFSDTKDRPNKIAATYTSRVAEIFQVILKAMGIKLEFVDEDTELKALNNSDVKEFEIGGRTYLCTEYQYFLMKKINDFRNEILEVYPVITKSNLIDLIEEELRHSKYIEDDLDTELGDLSRQVAEELEIYYKKFQEEKEEEIRKQKEAEEKQKEEIALKQSQVDEALKQQGVVLK